MAARPYPYPSWQRVDKREAEWTRSALRALPGAEAQARAAAAAASALGAGVSVDVGAIELMSHADACAALASPLCALWLERSEGARTLPIVCDLPPELGAALVDRVLGGDGTAVSPLGVALDELSCGVLAYLGARVCAALDVELRVRAALTEPARAHALLGGDGARVLVLPLTLSCTDTPRGRVRLWIAAEHAGQLSPRAGVDRARPSARLSDLPIALCAHAGHATLKQRELDTLAPGDVVVPDRLTLSRSAHGYEGAIALHAVGSRRHPIRAFARDALIRIESVSSIEEPAMTEAKRIDTQAMPQTVAGAANLAGDAPIELCLELARFTLPLDALSALCAGEVLSTGRPIGARVSLSAAGRTIARGELVDIEGEIGLRILDLVR